jgi:hypothetical protein
VFVSLVAVPAFPCLDCDGEVEFADPPSDAACAACGLEMFLTSDGVRGRYPSKWRGGLDYQP